MIGRAAALWVLLGLFALRVVGQLAVASGRASFLPPMEQWQSGLMPYPALVVSQVAVLMVFGLAAVQFSRGTGYFVARRWWLGRPLWIIGWIYAAAMVARYVLWMALRPEERWTGDLIPVIFHIVLAAFLLTVADHHRHTR
jgi:hypothetical protein